MYNTQSNNAKYDYLMYYRVVSIMMLYMYVYAVPFLTCKGLRILSHKQND